MSCWCRRVGRAGQRWQGRAGQLRLQFSSEWSQMSFHCLLSVCFSRFCLLRTACTAQQAALPMAARIFEAARPHIHAQCRALRIGVNFLKCAQESHRWWRLVMGSGTTVSRISGSTQQRQWAACCRAVVWSCRSRSLQAVPRYTWNDPQRAGGSLRATVLK